MRKHADQAWLQRLLRREAVEGLARERLELRMEIRALDPDVRIERSAERLLRHLADGAEDVQHLQKLAAIGQMAAGVHHEVRNSLTGVIGFAQLANRRIASAGVEETSEVLARIEEETRRCLEIVASMLDFSRRRVRAARPIEVPDLVQDVARLVRHQLSLARVQLELRLDPVPEIRGDATELKQVLVNLLLNALQALHPKGGLVRLGCARHDRGGVEISVADNGPGIPEALHRQIFQPFFTTKPPGEGSGLGLPISRELVEKMGGELSVESRPGDGARFVIRLPACGEPVGLEASK